MFRSLAVVAVLGAGLALPADAQQITEPEARHVVQAVMAQFDKAFANRSTAALGELYTEDAVRVIGDGTEHIGREAIEKWYGTIIKNWDEDPVTFDIVKIVGSDVIVAIGWWLGIWHGENGPVPLKGRWNASYVRVGDTWKVKVITTSNIPTK